MQEQLDTETLLGMLNLLAGTKLCHMRELPRCDRFNLGTASLPERRQRIQWRNGAKVPPRTVFPVDNKQEEGTKEPNEEEVREDAREEDA